MIRLLILFSTSLLLGAALRAQSAPPPPPSSAGHPLFRPRTADPMPIPPLTPGPTSSAGGQGLAPKRVHPIPLNLKEAYARLVPRAEWLATDTLFGGMIFEVTVDEYGKVISNRILRYKHFEHVEPYRLLLETLRFSPETLGDKPEKEGRTKVAFVWPLPVVQPSSEADSLPTDIEPVPVNLEQVRETIGYPLRARADRLEGKVIVRVLVNEFGTYVRHRVLNSAHPILTQAVDEWIYLLRFVPGFRARKPVRCWITIPFDFKPV